MNDATPEDAVSEVSAGSPPPKRSGLREAVDNPWVVLALLFFVMGFLGLPILWASRGFSRTTKVWLSLVVIVYTLVLIGCTGAVIWWSYRSIQESLAPFRA